MYSVSYCTPLESHMFLCTKKVTDSESDLRLKETIDSIPRRILDKNQKIFQNFLISILVLKYYKKYSKKYLTLKFSVKYVRQKSTQDIISG